MRLRFWIVPSIVLWLFHLTNALPEMKNKIHLTKIGDISPKDIMSIADDSRPADKRFLSTESTQENDVEAENNNFYHTPGNFELTTPEDQEEKFVNLLKKRYRGTFPEYAHETEADYDKNMELEENLDTQPETAVIGHSDNFRGKNRNINNFNIPDDLPAMDNLDSFDTDSNVMYPSSEDGMKSFHEEAQKSTDTPPHTTQRNQEEKLGEEYDESLNDYDEHQPISELTRDKAGTSGISNENDEQDANMGLLEDELKTPETNDDDDDDDVLDKERYTEELKKMTQKLKQESFGKVNGNGSLHSDGSADILHEFDELKAQQNNVNGKHSHGAPHKSGKKYHKSESSSKKIKYIHAEDSPETGDAILDFLDKLLEKDPQILRHKVLGMAKEMKNEEDGSVREKPSKINQQMATPGLLNNIKKKRRKKLHQRINKEKEIDQWIYEMEKGKGMEGITTNDQDGNSDNFKNEDYKQLHDQSQEIYPDGGGEVTSQETGDNERGTTMENGEKGDSGYKEIHDQSHNVYPDNNEGVTSNENVNNGDGAGKTTDEKSEKLKEQEYFDYEEFKEEALKMHNEFRRRHDAVALQWSDKLAQKAHQNAMQLIQATRSNFKRELEKQGQSIAILPYLTKNIAKTAVEKWYSEITKFSFADPKLKPDTRDFTQIIWKNSREIGMGFGYSPGNKRTVVVALYTPAGNNKEEIRANLNMPDNDPYGDIRKGDIEKHS